jgi:hypothetical protein
MFYYRVKEKDNVRRLGLTRLKKNLNSTAEICSYTQGGSKKKKSASKDQTSIDFCLSYPRLQVKAISADNSTLKLDC